MFRGHFNIVGDSALEAYKEIFTESGAFRPFFVEGFRSEKVSLLRVDKNLEGRASALTPPHCDVYFDSEMNPALLIKKLVELIRAKMPDCGLTLRASFVAWDGSKSGETTLSWDNKLKSKVYGKASRKTHYLHALHLGYGGRRS